MATRKKNWCVYCAGDSCDRIYHPWLTREDAMRLAKLLSEIDAPRHYYAKKAGDE